jgi:nitrate/nitrite transport system permease protein
MTDLADRPLVVDQAGAASIDSPASAPPPLPQGTSRLRHLASSMFWGAMGFLLLAAIWQIGHVMKSDLPGPAETLATLRELLAGAFATDGPAGQGIGLQLIESLKKVFSGFAMAALVGIPLGFLIGTVPQLWKMINPIVQLLRPVSPLAWFPIWLTVMVKAEPAAIWVIFITALWPVVINTAAGAHSVPPQEHDVARVFRFSRWAELRHIVVPHAMPSVITGLRLSMGIAWMVIVAAEMLSAATGIGFFVWQSYNGPGLKYVLAAILLAAILIIGVIGVVLDQLFLTVQRRLTHEGAPA